MEVLAGINVGLLALSGWCLWSKQKALERTAALRKQADEQLDKARQHLAMAQSYHDSAKKIYAASDAQREKARDILALSEEHSPGTSGVGWPE